MAKKTDLRADNIKSRSGGVRGFLGLLSFSTILPINIHTSIEEMARFTWLWPIIGGFIGIIVGVVGYALTDLIHLPQLMSAAMIYCFAIWFTGFHHLDGLVDFGDAMMAHAHPHKSIEIMRDMQIGTGGLAYLFIVAIITFTTLASAPLAIIFSILLVSELTAKIGLITCCTFSKPYPNGTGRYFIEAMNWKVLCLSLIITLVIGYVLLNLAGILGIVGGLLGGVSMAFIAHRKFEYATGDILGASNEISRMLGLIFMVVFLNLI